jgi:hypothetical protein
MFGAGCGGTWPVTQHLGGRGGRIARSRVNYFPKECYLLKIYFYLSKNNFAYFGCKTVCPRTACAETPSWSSEKWRSWSRGCLHPFYSVGKSLSNWMVAQVAFSPEHLVQGVQAMGVEGRLCWVLPVSGWLPGLVITPCSSSPQGFCAILFRAVSSSTGLEKTVKWPKSPGKAELGALEPT